jgi:ABC-type cobalamin transport system permease subunit
VIIIEGVMRVDGITFEQILSYLLPTRGFEFFDIMLYIMFFMALLALFTTPDKNMVPTLLLAGVLLFIIVAKLSTAAIVKPGAPIMGKKDFGMYAINVGMLVFPLIAIGLTRKPKSTSKVKNAPFAILGAVLGAVYDFAFWMVHQRV